MPHPTEFKTIEPEDRGKMKRIAWILTFATLALMLMDYLAMQGGDYSGRTGLDVAFFMCMEVCFFPLIAVWLFAWHWESNRMIDPNNRICSNCETSVQTSAVVQTNSCEVLGVSESTRAITSSNPVVGVTSTGGHMGVGVGTMQSTSHVPVKLGKVKLTVSCPSCSALFSWIENREVVQWTDPSGQVSYEIPGIVTLP
jgi:hypothetical protein